MILAADLGSTRFKAALFASDGTRLAQDALATPYRMQAPGVAELDPHEVRQVFFRLVSRVLARAGSPASAIRRVALTGQAQTFCVCDRDGRALGPLLGWSDLRAEREMPMLSAPMIARFHAVTGVPAPDPRLMLSKVAWCLRHLEPPPGFRVMSLSSWLAIGLGAPHAIDINQAAMTGLYSIPDGAWWEEALAAAGLEAPQAGRLVAAGEALATDAGPGSPGFAPGLEVIHAGNDHSAAAFGCGDGGPLLTLGTAGVLYRRIADRTGPFSPKGLWGPFPGGGWYELHATDAIGSAVHWADRHLFGNDDVARFVGRAFAKSAGGTDPYFNLLQWGGRSAWSKADDPGRMAYAVIEATVFAMRTLCGLVADFGDGPVRVLGGGAGFDAWMQLLADALDRPVVRAHADGLDGAALLAGGSPRPGPAPEPFFPDPVRVGLLGERHGAWSRFTDAS
jgi:xylulokinase